MHTQPKPIHSGIMTNAEIQSSKPTSRAKLKKEIQRAVNTYFNEQKFSAFRVIENRFHGAHKEFYDVAVGTAEIEFDESDPHVMRGALKYKHGHHTTLEESSALLDGLTRSIGVQCIGPVGCHIEISGCNIPTTEPSDVFRCDFAAKCPAA